MDRTIGRRITGRRTVFRTFTRIAEMEPEEKSIFALRLTMRPRTFPPHSIIYHQGIVSKTILIPYVEGGSAGTCTLNSTSLPDKNPPPPRVLTYWSNEGRNGS